MSADLLKKLRYKLDSSRKYYVNCDQFTKDPGAFHLNTMLKYETDLHVIQATVERYLDYQEFSNQIVIKMAKYYKTLKKEYDIGNTLQNIPGFIRFICIFQCYDNTSAELPLQICNSTLKDETTRKLVLIMPYYPHGSIRNFPWIARHSPILKSLLKQIVASIYLAFQQYGFLHSDLHLDNVLITTTKDPTIYYNRQIIITSHGYQAVVMDFEMSFLGIEQTIENRKFYWADLLSTFNRLYELTTIATVNLEQLVSFLNNARMKFLDIKRTPELFKFIDQLEFVDSDRTKYSHKYNPNVY